MKTFIPYQPNNPSTTERYKLLNYTLEINKRPEDFNNIVKLLNPPDDITTVVPAGTCKGIKVAILGGGLAGLSSAFELRKLGFDVTIFEAEKKRIGGRVYTHFFDRSNHLYGELGPMRFPVSHQTTWHYINLFNLNTRPFIQTNENAFRYVRGIRVRNQPQAVQQCIYPLFDLTPEERSILWPTLESQAFEAYLLELSPEIRKEILQIKELYSPEINKADYFNIRQMMEKSGLSDGAIEMLSSVNPFIGAFLNNSYFEILNEVYAANFAFMYEIIGGLVKLPEAFYHSLLNPYPCEYGPTIPQEALGKVQWKSGHQVIGLSQNEKNGCVAVHYKKVNQFHHHHEHFDFVVCAIPFSNLRLLKLNPLFSSKKMHAIRVLNMEASQKTIFLCNRRFWEEGSPQQRIIGGGSATDLVINTIWYPSDHAQFISNQEASQKIGCFESYPCSWSLKKGAVPQSPGVFTASYNWTQDSIRLGNFKEEDIPKIVMRQVEEVHGLPKGYLDKIVVDHKTIQWNNHPWSLGAFTFYTPQQNSLFSKISIELEYCNRVFFAGEHVSVSRAWMQGALQTGMLAANGVAMACKPYF